MIFASGCEPPPVEGPINVSDEEAEAAAAMEYSQHFLLVLGMNSVDELQPRWDPAPE